LEYEIVEDLLADLRKEFKEGDEKTTKVVKLKRSD